MFFSNSKFCVLFPRNLMELRVFYGKIIADHSAVEMFLSPRKTFISANYFLIVLIISKSILIWQKKNQKEKQTKRFPSKSCFSITTSFTITPRLISLRVIVSFIHESAQECKNILIVVKEIHSTKSNVSDCEACLMHGPTYTRWYVINYN